jgi:hypothetical protein
VVEDVRAVRVDDGVGQDVGDDQRKLDARAWITLMGPALWAGKGSGRADRGTKVLGYGSGLAAAGSCSVLRRRHRLGVRVRLGHRRVRTSRRQACASGRPGVVSASAGARPGRERRGPG